MLTKYLVYNGEIKMKKRIIAFSLLAIFLLLAPSINANICNTTQEEPEKQLSNNIKDDEIDILCIWGGRSVNVLVKNIADKDLYNIDWAIGLYHWHGGDPYLYGKGRIGELPVDQRTVVSLKINRWNLMEPKVSIHVGEAWDSPFALWIGPFILFRNWFF